MPKQIYPNAAAGSGHPRIRSFHGRQGRLSETRLNVLSEIVPKFVLSRELQDLSKTFNSEVSIDFGAGMGGHSKRLLDEGKSVLAIDVHTAGICDLAEYAFLSNMNNLLVHHGDGLECLEKYIAPNSISQIHLYFPDPWPKKRHYKRRVFNSEFIALADRVLVSTGKILVVTDDDSYAEHVREQLAKVLTFSEGEFTGDVTLTSYHQRALRLHHKIHAIEIVRVTN